eukprot:8406875-Pyramimonas_sp.AAC.1
MNSNIQTEDRFARCRKFSQTCSGKAFCPSTLGSNHFNSEFAAMHRLAVEKFRNDAAAAAPPPRAVGHQPVEHRYRRFVSARRRGQRGVSLESIAAEWRDLSEEERQSWVDRRVGED